LKLEKATAIAMANVKGAKKKFSNLLEFAEACEVLIDEYGMKETARQLGISKFMLIQIDKINDLDNAVRQLVRNGELGIESAYLASRIDEKRRFKAAKLMDGMTKNQLRTFVHFLVKDPTLTVEAAKQMSDEVESKGIKILILPLERDLYEKINLAAAKKSLKIHDYVHKLLEEHAHG
jgi:polyhydroxyalkanoate synthesis regulator phasin